MEKFSMEKFVISKAVDTQIDEIKKIADIGVGKNFFSKNDLISALSSKHCFLNVLLNAENKVIGYNLNYLLPRSKAFELFKISESEANKIADKTDQVGILIGVTKSMSILSEYRKQGLGLELLTFGISELFANGADFLLASAWKAGTQIPISGVFNRLGFKFLFIKEKPWYDMDMYCPYCKSSHCSCDAAIYVKGKEKDETQKD